MSTNGKPQDWHDGCVSDAARNHFIIPEIINITNNRKLRNLGFLGCATGYIPEQVSQAVSVDKFILIDTDKDRLEYAKTLNYQKVIVEFYDQPLEKADWSTKLDAMIISNTLLEFEVSRRFIQIAKSFLKQSGKVIIFLPDTLEDVVQDYVAGNRLSLIKFIAGVTEVKKIDKFTLVKTDFFAHRFISLTKMFLDCGFTLLRISISSTKPKYYMLVLQAEEI